MKTMLEDQFNISFIPTNMISCWNRTSLSANFCSSILTIPNEKTGNAHNTISTLTNELIEFCIKYGANKTTPYDVSFSKNKEDIFIQLSFYLIPSQYLQLKSFISAIKKSKKLHSLESLLLHPFTELGISLHSLIHEFNGKINISKKKQTQRDITQTVIKIKLNEKELY